MSSRTYQNKQPINFNPGLALIAFWTTRPWVRFMHPYFIWKNISSLHGEWVSLVGEILGTHVLHGAFWFAEICSLQYFRALSHAGKCDEFLSMWNKVDIYPTQVNLSQLAARFIWTDPKRLSSETDVTDLTNFSDERVLLETLDSSLSVYK